MDGTDELIIAVNCGSSSIKFKLFTISHLKVLVSGQASNIVTKGAKPSIKYVVHGTDKEEKNSEEEEEDMTYDEVFRRIITLVEESLSTLRSSSSLDGIRAVAHRVVHGGNENKPMVIYPEHEEGLAKLDDLSVFAPLHNHRAVQVVKFCLGHLPNSRQILLFDTLFHSTLPRHIYTYPLAPPDRDPPIPLRKYGAHGLSYASVLDSMAKHLRKPEDQINLIVAHLGSGASVCAVLGGKSLDTSMGLTPLDGLPGGTRTGSIDPVLIFHHTPSASELTEYNGISLSRGEMMMNKQGGLQAIAGTSNFGIITSNLTSNSVNESDKANSQLAYDLFLDRLLNYIGSYVIKIRGSSPNAQLNGIIFSGGIGERSEKLRADVGRTLSWLGCQIDESANQNVRDDKAVTEITMEQSQVKIFVCKTDEETQCAKMAMAVLTPNKGSV